LTAQEMDNTMILLLFQIFELAQGHKMQI